MRGDDNVSDISRLQLAAAVEKAAQAQAAQIIERMDAKMLEMESKMAQLKKQLAAQATELGQLKATGREIRRRTEAVDCLGLVVVSHPCLYGSRG